MEHQKKTLTDNGGEFANSEFPDRCEAMNINVNHMAQNNLFDVVNSVILKFPAVVFSF